MNITGLNIGSKIKKLRELKNFTQSHMAEELGISQSTYSKIEMGEVDVSMSKLEKISSVLGLTPQEVFTFNEQMIFNVMYNQNGHNGFVINKGVSENEIEIYKDQIQTLKNEIEHLKKIIDSLL
jgi:transcriptional regulator with XRE-family HTH domain